MADGSAIREIAETLFISEKTAIAHVSRILGKLGAANRMEAVAIARRRELLRHFPARPLGSPPRANSGNLRRCA